MTRHGWLESYLRRFDSDRTVFPKFLEAEELKSELNARVAKYKNEILLAALIENVNVRGRIIEYLIAGEDDALRQRLIAALKSGANGLPAFKTDNTPVC